MRHWKRVVAVLAVAAVALLVEGWVARAQAVPTLFKNCAKAPCAVHSFTHLAPSPTSTVLGKVTTGQPVLDRLTTSPPAALLEVLIG